MSHACLQFVMPFTPVPSFAPDDFIRGTANAQALDWIERWPDWPYSIALIHGPKGSGKTHLAHRFAAQARAVFLPAQRVGTAPADTLLAGSHAWVLDDVDHVHNEAALAQLINHVRARGDYLLLLASADAPSLHFTLPDLCSRLRMLPAFTLGTPDDALLKAVLAKAFADRQLRVAPEVLEYAMTHLERSYQAALEFVDRIDGISLGLGRAVTLPLVRETLR